MVYLTKTFSQTKMMPGLSYGPFESAEHSQHPMCGLVVTSHHSLSKGDKRKQKMPLCFVTYCVT